MPYSAVPSVDIPGIDKRYVTEYDVDNVAVWPTLPGDEQCKERLAIIIVCVVLLIVYFVQ